MKKNCLTNNVYIKDIKNIYSFDKKIYSEKFTHLITDFFFINNDLKKSINIYYKISNDLKVDLNLFINKHFNNKEEVITFITNKNNLDISFKDYFSDYSLENENNTWFEKNLQLCYVLCILFHYKIYFEINPNEIPYVKDNLKLYYLIKKIINKNYSIDLYFSYFFNKFDFLKDAKSSCNIFKEEILSNNIIIYYKKEDLENTVLDLNLFNKVIIKNNSKYCDFIEELYYFKTNKFSSNKKNDFIIYDLLYSKINILKIKPYFIEEDKIHHIINETDTLNKNFDNVKIIFLKNISIFPIYLYDEYKKFFKNLYKSIIENNKGLHNEK